MGVRRRLSQEATVRFTGLPDEEQELVLFSDGNEVCWKQ